MGVVCTTHMFFQGRTVFCMRCPILSCIIISHFHIHYHFVDFNLTSFKQESHFLGSYQRVSSGYSGNHTNNIFERYFSYKISKGKHSDCRIKTCLLFLEMSKPALILCILTRVCIRDTAAVLSVHLLSVINVWGREPVRWSLSPQNSQAFASIRSAPMGSRKWKPCKDL